MRKIRLLKVAGVPVAKNCSHGLGVEGQSPTETATKMGRQGTVREKTFTYFAMSITLRCSRVPERATETFYMPAGSPVVSFTTTARKGTSSSPQMGQERAEIKPGVHWSEGWARYVPRGGATRRKSFRLWKCPECDATRIMGRFQTTAASSR